MKPRVVLIHNIVAPYRLPLFDELAKLVDLTVVICRANAKDRQWKVREASDSYQTIILPSRDAGPFLLNRHVLRTLRQANFDQLLIIDNEENSFTNLQAVWYARMHRKPYTLWSGHLLPSETVTLPIEFHDSFFHRQPMRGTYESLLNLIHRSWYRRAGSYLAYSVMSKDYLVAKGAPGSKIVVGTQAMSPTLLPPPTKDLKLPKGKLQLLYLGYLRPEKGIEVLADAIKHLPADSFDLHIVGDGPERARLEALELPGVHFHAYADAPERANWYANVDAMVLPTHFDPWAHVVTESLYYGTPVIVSNSAAASTIIKEGKTGFVFPGGNSQALRSILERLVLDRSQISSMKQAIAQADLSRLYDVAADAANFAAALQQAAQKRSTR